MNIIAISNDMYDDTTLLSKKDMFFIRKKKELSLEKLREINPEYVFFPHWSHIVSAQIYGNFQCIIFHMTDLPFGRGGSPMQNLISRGIYDTKISAIKCVEDLDAGDVYLKRDFSLREGSARELYVKAGEIISSMIDEILKRKITPIPQEGEIVEFKRRTAEQSNIADISSTNRLYDHIRMLDAPGYPMAFFKHNNMRFTFCNASLQSGKIKASVEIEEI